MIRIIEIGDIAWQGKTEPVFCRAEDGHEYVVKGSFAGRKALIAEWVANRLDKLLQLPIPDFEQLRLDPQLLEYSSEDCRVGASRRRRFVWFPSRAKPGGDSSGRFATGGFASAGQSAGDMTRSCG